MNYFDITFLGYGAGLVIAFWFFGLCVNRIFSILQKIGFWCALLIPSLFLFPSKNYADDFIQLPPGIDWASVFSDLMALISPFVLIAICFCVYKIIKKALLYI